MYVDIVSRLIMQLIAAVLILLMFSFDAHAVHYNKSPRAPKPNYSHCCVDNTEYIKSIAVVAVGLAVVSLVIATRVSENNRGHIVLAQF